MIEILLFGMCAAAFGIFIYIFIGFCYAGYMDWKHPPEPIHYVWRYINPDYKGEWDRGDTTSVYVNEKTNVIRGKVVKQSDGLWRATMWNGAEEDFMYEYEATKAVEEYKPRVYK